MSVYTKRFVGYVWVGCPQACRVTVIQLGFQKKLRRAVKGGIDSIFNAEFISEFKKIRKILLFS